MMLSSSQGNGYRRRKAWELAKQAFGSDDLAEMLTRLERVEQTCPRILLAAAIHTFVSFSQAKRARAVRRYLLSLAHPKGEIISMEEKGTDETADIEVQFRKAMKSIGFK